METKCFIHKIWMITHPKKTFRSGKYYIELRLQYINDKINNMYLEMGYI